MIRRLRNILVYTFAGLGFVFSVLLVAGLVADYRNFDPTSGGYEPPYTGYTGTPIDFDAGYRTEDGIYGPGWVWSSDLDCTTGRVTFHFFNKLDVEWRKVSPRAIAIHKPQDACRRRGFEPEFGPQASTATADTAKIEG